MSLSLLIFLLSFGGVWFGSGLAIRSIQRIAHGLRISSFAVSFLVLGFFTSLGEMSVGVNAVLNDDPEIFVGNLIGATIVIFMLIIPLLAITGKKVAVTNALRGRRILFPLIAASIPVLVSLNGKVDWLDGVLALSAFILSSVMTQTKQNLLEKASNFLKHKRFSLRIELLKVLIGVLAVFGASHLIVQETLILSELFNLSPFFISLLFIALGTNLPELSLVIRSLFMRDKQVAFGNYLGSATMNTGLFGVFTLWYGRPIALTNSYLVSLVFSVIGLVLFYFFAKSKYTLSRWEGLVLLSLYVAFIVSELMLHRVF